MDVQPFFSVQKTNILHFKKIRELEVSSQLCGIQKLPQLKKQSNVLTENCSTEQPVVCMFHVLGPNFLFQKGKAKSHKNFALQSQNPHTGDNGSCVMTLFLTASALKSFVLKLDLEMSTFLNIFVQD